MGRPSPVRVCDSRRVSAISASCQGAGGFLAGGGLSLSSAMLWGAVAFAVLVEVILTIFGHRLLSSVVFNASNMQAFVSTQSSKYVSRPRDCVRESTTTSLKVNLIIVCARLLPMLRTSRQRSGSPARLAIRLLVRQPP